MYIEENYLLLIELEKTLGLIGMIKIYPFPKIIKINQNTDLHFFSNF